MPVVSTFARRVRQRRTELGLSQEALAELSGLDRTYISGIERGVRNPTLSTAEKLAEALSVPLAWLVTARD
jgi:transcriptional regulator with XRE-family HTH domain